MRRRGRRWVLGAGQFLLSLALLTVLVFLLSRLAPGDPLRAYYGEGVERLSQTEKQNARQALGLDAPLPVQFFRWLQRALRGDLGISFQYKQPVSQLIGPALGNTLLLGGTSTLVAFALALPLGVLCARREGGLADRLLRRAGAVLGALPSFWVALLLILLFGVLWRVLPTGGAYALGAAGSLGSRLRHLILPVSVLALGHVWEYAYLVRGRMLEEMRKEYVLTLRSMGLSRQRILYAHCLRNLLPTLVSQLALSAPHLIGGAYVVESVFSYPGLGLLSFESAKYHDYNLLLALCVLTGAVTLLAGIAGQALSERLDPRLSREEGQDG